MNHGDFLCDAHGAGVISRDQLIAAAELLLEAADVRDGKSRENCNITEVERHGCNMGEVVFWLQVINLKRKSNGSGSNEIMDLKLSKEDIN
ncbi:hypothetical protein RRG08_040011 [Elysia crispata]|uniref:Uncharacterized protein n=1 Tax=Elysia crispata TaxID=231223 RepID=A0AAE1DC16_9GAST|nr:hypothetical protein RRG08_040011 [Elysia crispata]